MVKIEVEKTELIWPGKYDEDGKLKEIDKINLPFQIIETINSSRAEREKRKKVGRSLYDFFEPEEGDTVEDGWKNKLIWGDNKLVISSLLRNFAEKIDFIYIDPPFATGADFSFMAQIGDTDIEIEKEQSIIEEKAYRDTWGKGLVSYAQMLWDRLRLMKNLLNSRGTIAVHVDWRVGYLVKAMLDEIFGADRFINEIIWYYTGAGASPGRLSRRHDNIYWYANGDNWFFDPDPLRTEYAEATKERFSHYIGNIRGGKDFGTQELNPKGKHPDDVIKISIEAPSANERTGYATQKPIALMQKLTASMAPKGGLVADFFVGSGTTLKACELTGNRWIGCDLSRWAIHTTRKRLLDVENCKPFEILNLGKYERQYWQSMTFGDKVNLKVIYEYIAFILKIYKAAPLTGTQYIHGKKSNALIHVGAVDSPVTIDEINLCLDECKTLKQTTLHVLGWEWEMGLNDVMINEAKSKGINLVLLNIPREVMEKQAVDKGDVKFFELAHVDIKQQIKPDNKIQIELNDFAMSNIDLIPDEVRQKIKKWSDYIDYWAIDWDFRNDTFMNGWVSYRTKRDMKLKLKSDIHKYSKQGKYNVMVKVVDIFGNDTSIIKEIEVK